MRWLGFTNVIRIWQDHDDDLSKRRIQVKLLKKPSLMAQF